MRVVGVALLVIGCGASGTTSSQTSVEHTTVEPTSVASLDETAPPEVSNDLAEPLGAALSQPLRGHVSLDQRVLLARTPEEVQDVDDRGWRAWLAGPDTQGRIVEVLEDAGARIHVKTLVRQPCANSHATRSWYELHGWVSRDALLPLIAEDVSVRHEDGTGLLLRAGQRPSHRGGRAGFWLHEHRDFAGIHVDVAPESLGFSVPTDHEMGSLGQTRLRSITGRPDDDTAAQCDMMGIFGRERTESQSDCHDRLRREAEVGLNVTRPYEARLGGEVVLRRTCRSYGCTDEGALAYTSFDRNEGRRDGDGAVLVLTNQCMQVVLRSNALPRRGGGGAGRLGGRSPDQCISARRGTGLFWEDGTEAGTVRRDIALPSRPLDDPLTCSASLVRDAAHPVCFRSADLGTTPNCWSLQAW